MATCEQEKPISVTSESTFETLDFRRCSRCWQDKPIQQFRFKRKAEGIRHEECNQCENERQRAKRRNRNDKAVRDFNYAVRRKRCPEAIALLCQELVRQFGGFANAARIWREALDSASQAGRHASVLKSFATLAELLEAHQTLGPHASDLTDEELEQRKNWSLLAFVRQYPRVAVEAARTIGWQVVPVASTGQDGRQHDGCTERAGKPGI